MRILISIVLLFCTISLIGQHENILIGDSIDEFFPEEPCIMLDEKNPGKMIVGANIDNYYKSENGGLTWEHGKLSSPFGVWGDPCIVADSSGAFYFFHLSDPPGEPWVERIICQKQSKWERNFEYLTNFGYNDDKLQDKEWATIDKITNRIYVAWTQWDEFGSNAPGDSSIIVLSKSTDLGQSWSDPVRLSQFAGDCVGEDNTVQGAVPAIGPGGNVYISWAGKHGIYFDKSTNYGESWMDNDLLITDLPGGWYYHVPGLNKANGMPITDCDLSGGEYHGNIYINWSDQRNGTDDTDIWFLKSIDEGETWSERIRVNDDGPGKHQFLCWMDVDQATGYIYIVFYDRRNYDDTNTDVFLAVSKDGGESFDNFKISETPFIPYSSVFFGDYTNIVAYNNIVRPVWTRLDEEHLSVWTAIIDHEALGISNKIPAPYSEIINYPNPFNESMFISFRLRQLSLLSIELYDVHGRLVSVIVQNELRKPGKYVEKINQGNLQLNPGIYFCVLKINNEIITRKAVFNQ